MCVCAILHDIDPIPIYEMYLQSGASYTSQGFEDNVLGSSSGWLADTVATYCPGSPSQLTKTNVTKYGEGGIAQHCIPNDRNFISHLWHVIIRAIMDKAPSTGPPVCTAGALSSITFLRLLPILPMGIVPEEEATSH